MNTVFINLSNSTFIGVEYHH